jgi:hypothetical protein
MNELKKVAGHHSFSSVTDQWLIDRLFSHDLRVIEVKHTANAFMGVADDKRLQSYIAKSKNPNKRGSGGIQYLNPVRAGRDSGVFFAVLTHHVDKMHAAFKAQIEPDSQLHKDHRLLLLAALNVWESFQHHDVVLRKKTRLIDLISVLRYRVMGDWELFSCKVCETPLPRYDNIACACPVCAAASVRKGLMRVA